MGKSSAEKDVGLFIDEKLFDRYMSEKKNKANSVLGAIRRSFEYLDKDTLKKIVHHPCSHTFGICPCSLEPTQETGYDNN